MHGASKDILICSSGLMPRMARLARTTVDVDGLDDSDDDDENSGKLDQETVKSLCALETVGRTVSYPSVAEADTSSYEGLQPRRPQAYSKDYFACMHRGSLDPCTLQFGRPRYRHSGQPIQ